MKNKEYYKNRFEESDEKFKFYIHLFIYIAMSIVFIVFNLSSTPESLWFQWPIMGWGIGVVVHALKVFVFSKRMNID